MGSFSTYSIYKDLEMKKTFLSISSAVVIAFCFAGCYSLNLTGTPAGEPISLSNKPDGQIVKHFSMTKTVHHLIAGLVTLNDINVAQDIDNEVRSDGGTHAVNVKITYNMPFIYGLVNIVTFNIYNPFEVTVEGDIVK